LVIGAPGTGNLRIRRYVEGIPAGVIEEDENDVWFVLSEEGEA